MSYKLLALDILRSVKKSALAVLGGVAVLAGSVSIAQANSKYASIVIDGNTGKVLQQTNADAPRYPASLTKIMTLYILFDYMKKGRIKYDTKFYVTPQAAKQPPSKLGLKVGNYIHVREAIGALVTKSANDVAATVAENIAGSEEKFARLMTSRARSLGLTDTVFKNASGLPHKQQRTTARDMAKLSMRVMNDFPRLSKHFKTKYFKHRKRSYRNHNRLLFTYKGVEGIKTGYTRASGFNLTTSVRRGNKHLIAVVMGGRSSARRNKQMATLLNRHLPTAVAMKQKRPLRQRIAKLDPTLGQKRPSVTGSVKSWPQKTALKPQKVAAPNKIPSNAFIKPFSEQYGGVGFAIQVGSFANRNEAVERLTSTQQRAGKLLTGYKPYIMEFQKGSTNYHRARFAGFPSRGGAKSACSRLKRGYKIDCFVASTQ